MFCGKCQKSQNLKVIRAKINLVKVIPAQFRVEDDNPQPYMKFT